MKNEAFENFIGGFKEGLENYFKQWNECDKKLTSRGFSDEMLSSIMSHKPLSVAVPTEYGGRGMDVRECLSVLEAASYESLPLSLIFGINIALFLEPFYKYADDSIKENVYAECVQRLCTKVGQRNCGSITFAFSYVFLGIAGEKIPSRPVEFFCFRLHMRNIFYRSEEK